MRPGHIHFEMVIIINLNIAFILIITTHKKEAFLHKQEKENGKTSKLCDDLSGDGIAQALVNRIRPEM